MAYYADRVINVDKVIDGYAFKTIDGVHYLTDYIGDDTELTLPNDYEGASYQIGERAFKDFSNLTAINIPKGVTNIYDETFANCPDLLDVYCYADSVPSTEWSAFSGSYIEYATLHVPASALKDYRATAPWSSFYTIIALTDEEMSIDNSEFIFDLAGRRVENPAKGGIYIVNGKKVVVK